MFRETARQGVMNNHAERVTAVFEAAVLLEPAEAAVVRPPGLCR
jgi:hypothetical protein